MKIHYDPKIDVLTVKFNQRSVAESDEEDLDVILDYDADRSIVGIEIFNA